MMSGIDEKPERLIRSEEEFSLHEDYVRVTQELERERENYIRLQKDTLRRAEDYATPIIETTMNAIMATREAFDVYYRPSRIKRLKRWIKHVWKR